MSWNGHQGKVPASEPEVSSGPTSPYTSWLDSFIGMSLFPDQSHDMRSCSDFLIGCDMYLTTGYKTH